MAARAAVPLSDYTFQSSDEAEMMSLSSPERIPTPLESDTVEPPFVTINTNLQFANEAETVTLAPTPPPEQHPMLDRVDSIKSVPPRSTIKLIFSVWLVEITCTFISLVVLTAVASILGVNNGRPNPEWNGGITLNTIVSFGSMFFRISLMVPVASCISQLAWIWFAQARRPLLDAVRFEHASRSISGSLSLIYTHHFKTVASIGAVITVAGLGTGPFLQQTLVFYSASVLDTSAAAYVSTAIIPINSSTDERPNDPVGVPFKFHIRSAVSEGFASLGVHSTPKPIFSCPSGNCTWDIFPTLAMNVSCRNAPESYRLNCTQWDFNYASDPINATLGCRIVANGRSEQRNPLGLPQQLTPDAIMVNNTYDFAISSPPIFHMAAKANFSDIFGDITPPYPNPFGQFADVYWIQATDLYPSWGGDKYIHPNSTLESKYCRFYNCIHAINASVTNGVYSESVVNEITAPVSVTGSPGLEYEEVSWAYTLSNGSTVSLSLGPDTQSIMMNSIIYIFEGIMDTNRLLSKRGNLTRRTVQGPELLQQIYFAPNITNVIVSVAQRVNVALRSYRTYQARELDPSLPQNFISEELRVPGSVWRHTIHVRVRWIWLALPASLLVLTIIFLMATIWLSRAEKVGIWKDNSLALLLFSRWDDQEKPSMGVAQTQEDIREAVKDMRAQLAKDIDVHGSDFKGTMLIERIPKSRK